MSMAHFLYSDSARKRRKRYMSGLILLRKKTIPLKVNHVTPALHGTARHTCTALRLVQCRWGKCAPCARAVCERSRRSLRVSTMFGRSACHHSAQQGFWNYIVNTTFVPFPFSLSIFNFPPASSARSCIPTRPKCPDDGSDFMSKPMPSSWMVSVV